MGPGYQLAVVLLVEVKPSSVVDKLSTAAINEVCTSTLSETTKVCSRSNLSCMPSSPLGCQARLQSEGPIVIELIDQHLLTLVHFLALSRSPFDSLQLYFKFLHVGPGLAWLTKDRALQL